MSITPSISLGTQLPLGSPFDYEVGETPNLIETEDGFYWNTNITRILGTMSVEINSADNGNNWLCVEPLGTAGIVENSRMPRGMFF